MKLRRLPGITVAAVAMLLACTLARGALAQEQGPTESTALKAAPAAPPRVVLVDPLKFKLDPPGAKAPPLVVRVYCPDDDVARIEPSVAEVRAPDGTQAPSADIDVKAARPKEGPCAFDVTLTPGDSVLGVVGEHTIVLRLAVFPASRAPAPGAADPPAPKPSVVLTTLKVERPGVELQTALPVLRLERPLPWWNTTGSMHAPLRLNTGTVLPGCKASIEPPVRKNGDGTLTSEPLGSAVVNPDCSQGTVQIVFSQVDQVGAATAMLSISAPALGAAPKRVPVQVELTDEPWAALVLILGGVGLALLFQWLAEKKRSQQVVALDIARLLAHLERLRLRTGDAKVLARLDIIAQKLAALRQRVAAGEIPAAAEIDAQSKALTEQETIIDTPPAAPAEEPGATLRRARPAAGGMESQRVQLQLVVVNPLVRAGSEVTLELRPTDAAELKDKKFLWSLGDGEKTAESDKPQIFYTFAAPGNKHLTVSVRDGDKECFQVYTDTDVEPSGADRAVSDAARKLLHVEVFISGISAVVATVSAFSTLYDPNKIYGTLGDYIAAFLWGFGIDAGVRGVLPVFKSLRKSVQDSA